MNEEVFKQVTDWAFVGSRKAFSQEVCEWLKELGYDYEVRDFQYKAPHARHSIQYKLGRWDGMVTGYRITFFDRQHSMMFKLTWC